MSTEKKVNLFLVGAAKSGTTSLAKLLSLNSEFFVPEHKEPFYFLEGWGVNLLEEYQSLYKDANKQKYLVDASTSYLYSKEAAKKIKEYNPNSKVIIILRNPIDFCFSYWKYMKANGNESSDFLESLSEETREFRKSNEFERKCEQWPGNYQYVDRALYSKQVNYYLDEFGDASVKIVLFENLINDANELEQIFEFLDVKYHGETLPKENSEGTRVKFFHALRFSPKLKFIKRLIKRIVSLEVRVKIRNYLRNKSFNRDKKVELNFDRVEVARKFNDDVLKLKLRLKSIDFSSWRDF